MKARILRLLTIGLAFSIISGCATTDANRTRAEGTVAGAVFGAALGAGVGYLTGGPQGALKGLAGGGVAGAGLGLLAGDAVAKEKQQYVEKEEQLDAQITTVAGYNRELREYHTQTSRRIRELNIEVASLKTRYQRGKARAADMRNTQDEIQAMVAAGELHKEKMKKELVALNEFRRSMKNAQQEQHKVAKLNREVETLKRNIALLDSSNKQLAQLLKTATVRR